MEIKRITPEEAKELLDSNAGYTYLDVRIVAEFEAGHVVGAKNIPVVEPDPYGRMQLNPRFLETVEANLGTDSKCITGCQKGGRSLQAAELLLTAGFTHVLDRRKGFGDESLRISVLCCSGGVLTAEIAGNIAAATRSAHL